MSPAGDAFVSLKPAWLRPAVGVATLEKLTHVSLASDHCRPVIPQPETKSVMGRSQQDMPHYAKCFHSSVAEVPPTNTQQQATRDSVRPTPTPIYLRGRTALFPSNHGQEREICNIVGDRVHVPPSIASPRPRCHGHHHYLRSLSRDETKDTQNGTIRSVLRSVHYSQWWCRDWCWDWSLSWTGSPSTKVEKGY